jgi:membrane associated rhomboid family serine protease
VPRDATLVGASGSILGIMAAATCIAPRYPIRFWFPPVTVQLWVLFAIAMTLALLALRMSGENAGGEAAHVGGAAAGLVGFALRGRLPGKWFGRKKRSRFWRPGDPASSFFRNVD